VHSRAAARGQGLSCAVFAGSFVRHAPESCASDLARSGCACGPNTPPHPNLCPSRGLRTLVRLVA